MTKIVKLSEVELTLFVFINNTCLSGFKQESLLITKKKVVKKVVKKLQNCVTV
jgi:hypothetical protein